MDENRWQDRKIEKDYIRDEKIEEDSPFKTVLLLGGIALGGIGLYKAGLFKSFTSKLYPSLNKSTRETTATLKTFKEWLNKDPIPGSSSLFRTEGVKDFGKRLTNLGKYGDTNFADDTLKDVETLFKDVKKAREKASIGGFNENELMINKEFNNLYGILHKRELSKEKRQSAANIKSLDIFKNLYKTEDELKAQFKSNGFRNLTLGDVFESKVIDGNEQLIIKRNSNLKDISFLPETLSTSEYSSELLERLKHIGVFKDGKRVLGDNGEPLNLFASDKWKNMIFDKDVFIDKKGNGIDLRNYKEDKRFILNSMANDFKIPFVGINPLKYFGLGNLNKNTDRAMFLNNESVQPIITGKKGRVTLKDAGLEDLFYSNGTVYKFNDETKQYEKFKEDIIMRYVPMEDYKVSKDISDLSKIADINLREYEDFDTTNGLSKNIRKKVGDTLDLGKQDREGTTFRMSTYEGVLSKIDPDTYIEKVFEKIQDKNIFNKGVKDKKTIHEAFLSDTENARLEALRIAEKNKPIEKRVQKIEKIGDNLYIAINKKINLRNAIDPESNKSILDYISQFLAGRKNLEDVTQNTLKIYYLFERMNQALGNFGLALSNKSIGSVQEVIINLLLKRFLPIYLGYQGLEYMISLTDDPDEDGDNIVQQASRAVVYTNVGLRKIFDNIGITKLAHNINQLTPGSEVVTELPLLNTLHLDKTSDELAEYYKKGMTPVRKGRLWNLGSTAFTGGKIDYYKPNLFRRIQADADFTDVKYGSRQEYFANAWFPTLTHPLAPIRHFITDRYHYEEKHYYDRPYLITSPEFKNVPLFGDLLGSTIGQIVKPQKLMHVKYLGDENVKSDGRFTEINNNAPYTYMLQDAVDEDDNSSNIVINTSENNNITYDNIEDFKLGRVKIRPDKDTKFLTSYVTNSGNPNVIDINDEDNDIVNEKLKHESITNVSGVDVNYNYNKSVDSRVKVLNDKVVNNSGIPMALSNFYDTLAEVTGIYGFLAQSFITGDLGSDKQVLQESGEAYSINDKFWEQELGGLGGDLSEISRRFIQKPRNLDKYNPVRNTMGTWLPEDYFIDFQHGDPYQRVTNGEIRLPGEAYEKLWDIQDPMKMELDSEYIGKTKEEIYNHLLGRDLSTEYDDLLDIEVKNKIIKNTQKDLLKSDIGIVKDTRFIDETNNITGSYNLKIRDGLLMNDEAVMKIQPVTDKQYKDIIKNGALNQNIKQVNYQLFASGDDRGYIRYVNASNNEYKDFKVKKDKELFKQTIQDLNEVRADIITKINNRELSRDDLYKPLDKLRILSDVAPYSDEYKQLLNKVSKNADDETRMELQEIKKRVSSQKKAHRTYEYKFKTADVDTIKTKITAIDGNSIYVKYNGKNRKVNLAGILTSPIKKNKEYATKLQELRKDLTIGSKVTLKVDADERIRERTIGLKAVLYDNKGVNINRQMVKQGLAVYKESDNSATSIHARFSRGERLLGSIWESITHLDTYVNTKLFHVRSAVEDYEREEVYGKSFKLWQHPIRDYLMPSIYHNIHRTGGVLIGGLVGSLFGRTKYGKAIGALIGSSAIAIGKINAFAYRMVNREQWVPKPRRQERELNEYVDILKYVKNMRYYNMYKDKALKEDGFDVDKYLKGKENQAKERKLKIHKIEENKKEHKSEYIDSKNERDDYIKNNKPNKIKVGNIENPVLKFSAKRINDIKQFIYNTKVDNKKEKVKEDKSKVSSDNKKIEKISTFRESDKLPLNALKALEYKEKAESTMYGYDKGDPITNILSALPKKDRDRFGDFMNAPNKERNKLLNIAPKYLRRPLESVWGMEVEDKEDLVKYFTKHQLPGEEWIGWDEGTNIDDVKVKLINSEGLSQTEFNVWDKDIDRANQSNVPIPHINYKSKARDIRSSLLHLLSGLGIEDTNIDYTYGGEGVNIDMDLEYSNREDVENKINSKKFIK